MIPSALRISGLTWGVRVKAKLKNDGGAVLWGQCLPAKQEILLDRSVLKIPDRARRTLLHEAIHAMLESSKHYDDEELVLRLEEKIDQFLMDNPDFRALYQQHP